MGRAHHTTDIRKKFGVLAAAKSAADLLAGLHHAQITLGPADAGLSKGTSSVFEKSHDLFIATFQPDEQIDCFAQFWFSALARWRRGWIGVDCITRQYNIKILSPEFARRVFSPMTFRSLPRARRWFSRSRSFLRLQQQLDHVLWPMVDRVARAGK